MADRQTLRREVHTVAADLLRWSREHADEPFLELADKYGKVVDEEYQRLIDYHDRYGIDGGRG